MSKKKENKNSNLSRAKNDKNDEFYTRIEDIQEELYHYKDHFKDKVVFCNCDDPYESKFWFYFHKRFNSLGLKKLITKVASLINLNTLAEMTMILWLV